MLSVQQSFYTSVLPHVPNFFFPPPAQALHFPFLPPSPSPLIKQEPEPEPESSPSPSSPSSSWTGRSSVSSESGVKSDGVFTLNDGKTTAYTYESFFASDGRSKNPASLFNVYKPKYKCAECGKNYATSSNLSRY